MSLNPEIAEFLDLVDANPGDGQSMAFHQSTPEQARLAFEQASTRMRWPAPEVQTQDLSCIARDGASLALRLYRPSNAGEQPLPVLLYLHGGGFVVGSIASHDGVCREFCARTPCAVLTVDYRRAPEHRFPVALDDCADTLAWLALNAHALELDVQRVALGGDSVGATLATVLAISAANEAGPITPCLQLLCYPVTDASTAWESRTLFAQGYLLEDETLQWFYDHYASKPQDRSDWRFSPLLATGLRGVAPAYVALAGYDPLLDEGRAYARHLQGQGVTVQYETFGGLVHDFLRMRMVTAEIDEVYQRLVAVLRNAFE
ncbi:alpha/beta hydrolase [Pseudomonas sp. 21LCFQ02]|uniref:alpha/beta hydrolase n=1 Tax=Pseudomonas sp. 21LCFQ02 TaxID=2957505 RepID=UPI00209A67BD|nr:alpha/beta hydrolase [Pseudomonas sp. 21LCFQ02]MCO8171480.1 alpha/beta hydrolase [Pseudomonas sp. 21LCFQ02]